MIGASMDIPLERVNDPYVDECLWAEIGKHIKKNIGYEEKYIFEFKKEIIPSPSFSPIVKVQLICKIKTVLHNNYVDPNMNDMNWNVRTNDFKVKRFDRFIQFIKGI